LVERVNVRDVSPRDGEEITPGDVAAQVDRRERPGSSR
jgi:hypothetical protein